MQCGTGQVVLLGGDRWTEESSNTDRPMAVTCQLQGQGEVCKVTVRLSVEDCAADYNLI